MVVTFEENDDLELGATAENIRPKPAVVIPIADCLPSFLHKR